MVAPAIVVMLTIVMLAVVVTLAVDVPAFMMPRGNLSHRSCLRRCLPWSLRQTDAVQPDIYTIHSSGKLEEGRRGSRP